MRIKITLLSIAMAVTGSSQEPWSMNQCMAYAADHASSVVQARWDLASASFSRDAALADFFPSVSAQVGTQLNWGRNIDLETNTYNDVTTFNNGYGLYASLTLFDGGQTLNRYKKARCERERYVNAVEMQRDDKAIATMMAYADAVYYQKSIDIARDKLEQSLYLLKFIKRQEELGMKARPDVAEAQATVANDNYALVHQQNLYSQAMLTLRSTMNLPESIPLAVDTATITVTPTIGSDNVENIYNIALHSNPKALNAMMQVNSSEYEYKIAKRRMMPSISINGGISTSYYKNLSGGYSALSFGDQIRNNRGEIERVAPTDANILIIGENGTGKDLLAREIHSMSSRYASPIEIVDMGAVSETLFESE